MMLGSIRLLNRVFWLFRQRSIINRLIMDIFRGLALVWEQISRNPLFINVNMNNLYIDSKHLTIQELLSTPIKKLTFLLPPRVSKSPKTKTRHIFLQGKKSFCKIYTSNKSLSPQKPKFSPRNLCKIQNRSKSKIPGITSQEFWKVIENHRVQLSSPTNSNPKSSKHRSKKFSFIKNHEF